MIGTPLPALSFNLSRAVSLRICDFRHFHPSFFCL